MNNKNNVLLNNEMLFHRRVEGQFVLRSEKATKTDENEDEIVVVFEHRHVGSPEGFEGFVLIVGGESVEQVFVVPLRQ